MCVCVYMDVCLCTGTVCEHVYKSQVCAASSMRTSYSDSIFALTKMKSIEIRGRAQYCN